MQQGQMQKEHPYKLNIRRPSTVILFFIFAYAGICVAAVTPSLHLMSKQFNISMSSTNLSITLALLGYTIAPLFSGPLSERFGRKPVILWGIIIAIIGCIVSLTGIFAGLFADFLIGRFIAVFGAALAFPMIYAILQDFYYEHHAKKVLAIIVGVFFLAPGITMTLCGAITHYINWYAFLYFLIIYGALILLAAWLALPETHTNFDSEATCIKKAFHNYKNIITQRNFIFYALIVALPILVNYTFVAAAPILSFKFIHMTPLAYGYWALLPFAAAFVVMIISGKISHLVSYRSMATTAFIVLFLAYIAMLWFFIIGLCNTYTLFILTAVGLALGMLLNVFSVPKALHGIEKRGAASALMSFIFMGLSMVCAQIYGMLGVKSTLVYPIMILIICVLGLVFYILRPNKTE